MGRRMGNCLIFLAVEEVADWMLENGLFNNWYSRKFASLIVDRLFAVVLREKKTDNSSLMICVQLLQPFDLHSDQRHLYCRRSIAQRSSTSFCSRFLLDAKTSHELPWFTSGSLSHLVFCSVIFGWNIQTLLRNSDSCPEFFNFNKSRPDSQLLNEDRLNETFGSTKLKLV